jgi:hypothetical protein
MTAKAKVKVKQTLYKPGQALRVAGGWGFQILWQSAHEGGNVVGYRHRPPLIDWLIEWGFGTSRPRCTWALLNGPSVPQIASWEPCSFTKATDGPQTYALNVPWLKNEGAQMHMSEWGPGLCTISLKAAVLQGHHLTGPSEEEEEAQASHSHRTWAEVSSFIPHPLHTGLSASPSRKRCLLRVLCPVRKPVTTLDWVLLRDKSLTLLLLLGPEISSRACLRVLLGSFQLAQCWLFNQRQWLFCISRLETPQDRLGPEKAPSRAVPRESAAFTHGTQFCYRLSAVRRVMSIKNYSDTIRNRARDLLACSAVPSPTAPLRTPIQWHHIEKLRCN